VKKKYRAYLPYKIRAEIVSSHPYVDHVLYWYDGTQYVDGLIRLLKPDYFTKGGDRSSEENCAKCEIEACQEVGCHVEYGVGGTDKKMSSSDLHKIIIQNELDCNIANSVIPNLLDETTIIGDGIHPNYLRDCRHGKRMSKINKQKEGFKSGWNIWVCDQCGGRICCDCLLPKYLNTGQGYKTCKKCEGFLE